MYPHLRIFPLTLTITLSHHLPLIQHPQGSEVAVKVITERSNNEVEVFRNAVELAVLSTLSHPNIVQVRHHRCCACMAAPAAGGDCADSLLI